MSTISVNCPNCQDPISDESTFCKNCGNKIDLPRISTRTLFSDFLENVLGWDNKYFRTLFMLFRNPKQLAAEYFQGARRKYMNPIGFFAIGMTLSILLFSIFQEEYMAISLESAKAQTQLMAEKLGGLYADADFQQQQLALNQKLQGWILRYYNIASFLLLPVYAFIAFLVFRKPLNYGEHLVISTYIQGVSFLISSLLFLLSIFVSPFALTFSVVALFFLYLYVYAKIYGLGIPEILLKILLFFAVVMILFIVFLILGFLIGYLLARFDLIDPSVVVPTLKE